MDWKRLTITERLTVLRKAYDLTQDTMAVEIGLEPDTDTYGHAERTGQIDKMARRIVLRFPEIDESWLFRGLTGNVTSGAEKRLSEAARDLGLSGSDRGDQA